MCVCVGCICAGVYAGVITCVSVCGAEVVVLCTLQQLLYTTIITTIEAGIFNEVGTCYLGYAGWPAETGDLSSHLASPYTLQYTLHSTLLSKAVLSSHDTATLSLSTLRTG